MCIQTPFSRIYLTRQYDGDTRYHASLSREFGVGLVALHVWPVRLEIYWTHREVSRG